MPNLCGVNQKMLAEVLSEVRKAPSVSQRKQGTTTVNNGLLVKIIEEDCIGAII